MSVHYCVHLFPQWSNGEQISGYRERFDPLASKIAPHITLVFPFAAEQDLLSLVLAHGQSVAATTTPFSVGLGDLETQPDGFVWLPVTDGMDDVHRLHSDLYTGPLTPFLRSNIPYTPHLTVGRVCAEMLPEAHAARTTLVGPFTAYVSEVAVEAFSSDNVSRIVTHFPLAG